MTSRQWNPFTSRRQREDIAAPVDGARVHEQCEQLERALALAGPAFPRAEIERTQTLLTRARQRTGLGAGHTVVALAGATGSGKSSLFNALVGADVAQAGVRRPTTSKAGAASWGQTPHELLDWIGGAGRHEVSPSAPGFAELEGLVLLDLPDIDSRITTNRREADRVLELCDVFVWVTDPQKYADALLHEEYIRQFAMTKAASVVVLNQIDRLPGADAAQCLADLAGLLARDGLSDARVVPASTVVPSGGEQLMEALADIVHASNAADRRVVGDLSVQAQRLSAFVTAVRPDRKPAVDAELLDALAQAAGLPLVLDAIERDYRREAVAATGWPFTRWIQGAKPRPLTRLGLDRVVEQADARNEKRAALGRSSLPPATPAAKASVELATRRLADRSSKGLPQAWADEVHDALHGERVDMSDALDQAILGTPLRRAAPRWWQAAKVLQWMFATIAVVGALWLVALAGLASVQIHLDAPTLGDWFPIPLLLLVAGLLAGLLLAWICRVTAAGGARRARAQASGRLDDAIEGVARERLVEPVVSILQRHDECAECLSRASI